MRLVHQFSHKPILLNKNVRYASELETLLAIEAHGDLNPIQRQRLEELKRSGSYGNLSGIESPTGSYIDSYSADPTYNSIMSAMNKQNEIFISKLKDFDSKNPFVYDQILADEVKKVGQRLDPYYKQTLDDYLVSVNRKRTRSLEDERRIMGEISQDVDDYTKENKQALEDVLSKSREGYADAGLYSSGSRMRAEGRLGAESQNKLQDYTTGQERRIRDTQLSTERNLQDLSSEQGLFQRDVGKYDPITGAFTRGARSEAETRLQAIPEVERRRQQREFEMRQYAGAPPGADQAAYYLDTYNLLR